MRVDIKMLGELYTAVVTTPDGETHWTTPEPMDRLSLLKKLDALRIDYREVAHALANADLRIAAIQRHNLVDVLSKKYGPERAKELLEKVDEEFRSEMEAIESVEEQTRRPED